MFVYLSKKIAIPNNYRLNCISWNEKHGYIAVGGEDGLLKVLKVDNSNTSGTQNTINSGKTRSTSSSTNLSINQTLEGHNGTIQVVTWNEDYQKLTSSDQNGVIIVWMLYKGSWYEEMINNRNKSVVRGMSWSMDGQKICIVYEDGAVIVGSVDGNRIWGKELKNTSLSSVQWSPDSKFLLFGLNNGTIHLYDNQGVFLMSINTNLPPSLPQNIVSMDWYNGRNGYTSLDCLTLAICYENGYLLLMKGINDDEPVIIETGITNVCCSWNTYGSVLAVGGIQSVINNGEAKDSNLVMFYTNYGTVLKSLKIPGREITSLSWEGTSLRLSLSVDSFIYFANIRPNYKWTYFSNTLVFTNERLIKNDVVIIFWNTVNNTVCTKNVKSLISIASKGDHCALAVTNHNDFTDDPGDVYSLLICNTITTPVDIKNLKIRPQWMTMTNNTVIVASKNHFYIAYYRTPKNLNLNNKFKQDKLYHIDDTPTGVNQVIQDLDKDGENFHSTFNNKVTMDPICCLTCSEIVLLIGRESGMIQRYSLPQVTLTNRYTISSRPEKMSINCNSSRASVIDISGVLTMLELERTSEPYVEDVSKFERKDVWAMCWAQDNPALLAIMEKTRMYVLKGLDPEEPILCSGYICSFKDLEIRCVLLDELIQKPDDVRSELIVDLEVKSLRDTKELLNKVGLKEAHDFIQDNPHPRLWRLLGESALKQCNLEMAENAMVRCTDYLGIQFIKRLQTIHNDRLKKAEVAAYLGNYDEAEKLYLDLDRRDLAIKLRQKLADYFRVIQLMKMGIASVNDKHIEEAYNKIGDFYAEKQNWSIAKDNYEKGRNITKLIHCYYKLENYDQLADIVDQLPDKSPVLKTLARMLSSVGMCSQAVRAFIKYGDVKQAVDTCVRLNNWDQAVDLAKTYKMVQINELLNKYANHLLNNGKILQAIELYKSANCYLEAAKLLIKIAEEQISKRIDPLRIKKIYVLTALLIEDHINSSPVAKGGRSNIVMGLTLSNEDSVIIENAWKGAEAFHFLLLAHRQIYDNDADAAMKTALRLREYEDVLNPEDVYCLLALSSAMNKSFGTCSKAFINLESIETISEEKKQEYEELALQIFLSNSPQDSKSNKSECVNCESLIPDWCIICPNCCTKFPPCIVSGKPLMDLTNCWICTVCRHYAASERDIVNVNACPLCHSIVTYM